jgi:ABC-type transport system involved in multi-copper enzyme maturation permease subunit
MAQETAVPVKQKRFSFKFSRPWDNPVIMKELRGRMRDRRTFILLTIYLVAISGFVGLAYGVMLLNMSGYAMTPDTRQNLGKVIFGVGVLIELLLISFIGPGLTAGAITSEREHRTLDLLKTTLLTTRELVLGKLGSSIIYLFLLIFTVLPVQSMSFIIGGVGMEEVIISSIMLVVTAVFFSSLGIFFSSLFKRTLAATVTAYGSILLSVLGVVFFFFGILLLESSYMYNSPLPVQEVATLILWFIISTNPILAAIFTEVMLVDSQSVFWTSNNILGTSPSLGLLSPWIIYVVTYTFFTVIILLISIWRVKRPEH